MCKQSCTSAQVDLYLLLVLNHESVCVGASLPMSPRSIFHFICPFVIA